MHADARIEAATPITSLLAADLGSARAGIGKTALGLTCLAALALPDHCLLDPKKCGVLVTAVCCWPLSRASRAIGNCCQVSMVYKIIAVARLVRDAVSGQGCAKKACGLAQRFAYVTRCAAQRT